MLRFARLFAGLRWRLFWNGFKGARRRDGFERFSRFGALALPAVVLVLVVGGATTLAVLAFIGGWRIGEGTLRPATVLILARVLLFALLATLVLVALGGVSHGAVARYTRLFLLPIPRRALHFVEVLASLGDPWIAALIPALVTFAAGLALGGNAHGALLALVLGAAILAVLATTSSLVSFALGWLVRSRRRSETYTLAFVLVISLVSLVPLALGEEVEIELRGAQGNGELWISAGALERWLPAWTRALPSELYGRSLAALLAGRTSSAWIGALALALEAALLYALSSFAHARLLRSTESAGSRRKSSTLPALAPRVPGFSHAASAVARAQFRTAIRSVRGRLIVLMPAPLIALVAWVTTRVPDEVPAGAYLLAHGHMLLGLGLLFTLYTLQALTLNQLASDRAGLTLAFLVPVSPVDLARGKMVGCALVFGVAMILCLVASVAVAPRTSPFAWLSVLVGGGATYLALAPLAVLFSAVFPVASDLSKTGKGGNPHGFAALVGMLLTPIAAAPAIAIIAWIADQWQRPALALACMVAWSCVVAAIALPLLTLAAGAIEPRRENLALVAQGR